MASRPQLRAAAALALAIYALILCAGPALLHGFACSGHGAPHCLLCATVESVAAPAQAPAVLARDRSDAGLVAHFGKLRDGVSLTASAANRAPPAA
jgi:hypothetical protein